MPNIKSRGDLFYDLKRKDFKKKKLFRPRKNRINFKDSFTLMVVPNSQKNTLKFKISILSIAFLSSILLFLVFSFFFLNTSLSVSNQQLNSTNENLLKTQADLGLVLNSVSKLGKTYESYRKNISEISDNLDISYSEDKVKDIYSDSDLASISYLEKKSNSQYLPQIQKINSVMSNLSKTIKPLKEASEAIKKQKQILADIPNFWPVSGSHRVTMEFGPNTNPITGIQYIHRGIDIGGVKGLPILSSANGKVIKVSYDPKGYGLNAIIEHKYGFKTRYAHMSAVNVKVGDIVRQGDVIGKMGATGNATGNHLHFEIMIGNQVIDPSAYLVMSNNFTRSNY